MDAMYFFAVNCRVERVAMNRNVHFLFPEISHPEIVIAADIVDMNSAAADIMQCRKNPGKPFGNGVIVFEPEIKEITKDDKAGGVGGYALEECVKFCPFDSFFVGRAAPQMGV
jgi:hypothetical protein